MKSKTNNITNGSETDASPILTYTNPLADLSNEEFQKFINLTPEEQDASLEETKTSEEAYQEHLLEEEEQAREDWISTL